MDLSALFLDLALVGGTWVLWLLVLLSILSIGVMIDRGLWFRRRDVDTDAFCREVRGAHERGELEHLEKKYATDTAVPVRVAMVGIATRAHGPAAVAEAMQGERARWRQAADRNLIVLGTLGNNVPFIGLFGTVLGVIKAFDDLKHKSVDSETLVMSGIADALVATAVGLLVAIPAVIAFNYFGRKLKVLMTGADHCAHVVLGLSHGDEYARDNAARRGDAKSSATLVEAEADGRR